MGSDRNVATWFRDNKTVVVIITGTMVLGLVEVLSSERISLLAIAAGTVVFPLLWVLSQTPPGSRMPGLGEPLTGITSAAVFLIFFVGFVALNAAALTGQLPISISQYYGVMFGIFVGMFCVSVVLPALRAAV